MKPVIEVLRRRRQTRPRLNHASVVDIADPAKPTLLSLFPLPVPPPGSPHKNFCEKGGRFGPHNVHQLYHNPRSEEHTSELQSRPHLVCRLLLEKKKKCKPKAYFD